MFPSQTSFIPIQIALAKFVEENGFWAIFGNYPYWYLGTTPFRYLTGPILPSILVLLHKLIPSFSLFEIMWGLIAIFWLIGAAGVYFLVRELKREGLVAILAATFYFFGPIVPFLFRFSDGLYLISFSFLPFVLLVYFKLLRGWTRTRVIFCIIMISFIILLDILIIPTLFLGMVTIFLVTAGWKKAEEKIKQTFLIFTFSFLISTFWYTPGYWWQIITAPSLAGKGFFSVLTMIGQLLPAALAMTLAALSVKFFKEKNLLRDFCFYWLFIFGFLTLIRFISDPDFWLDWSRYGTELQLGIAIGLGVFTNNFLTTLKPRISLCRSNEAEKKFNVSGLLSVSVVLIFIFGVWFLLFNKYVLMTLQRDIKSTVEYRIGNQLSQLAKPRERVFLSGTTAFWLNTFFNIPQVRGGRDQASVHPSWRQAVWEVREGTEVEKSLKWLRELEVKYLVVHTEESEEFYHDFVYPEKFENVSGLVKLHEERGDRIYRVEY